MDNKGLEALAALASAAPPSSGNCSNGNNLDHSAAREQANSRRYSSSGSGGADRVHDAGGTETSREGNSNPPINQNHLLHSGTSAQNLQMLSGLSPQQWQQAIASAATAAGMSPSGLLSAVAAQTQQQPQNVGVYSGLQQLPSSDQSLLVAVQNLAYYQLLSQSNPPPAATTPQASILLDARNQQSTATHQPVSFTEITQVLARSLLNQQLDPPNRNVSNLPPSLNNVPAGSSAHRNVQQGLAACSAPTCPDGATLSQKSSTSAAPTSNTSLAHNCSSNSNGGAATPKSSTPRTTDKSSNGSANSSICMPPPPPTAATAGQPALSMNTSAGSSTSGVTSPTHIAPQLSSYYGSDHNDHTSTASVGSGGGGAYDSHMDDDRKQQKRAANRKSAQLSRKRKKQFIEELKEENDDLRRKEQILRSIPDLIVVFDSSGKLCFVSQSVSRFMRFTASELEGTSFWDRLCEDSVRLLKAAFMDSLAARQPDSETAPLGSGVWELRLVDKDGTQKIVTLNGVVHFAGDRPECVCSIRPRDKSKEQKHRQTAGAEAADVQVQRNQQDEANNDREVNNVNKSSVTSSSREDSSSSDSSDNYQVLRVKPQQSVVSRAYGHGSTVSASNGSHDRSGSSNVSQGNGHMKNKRRVVVLAEPSGHGGKGDGNSSSGGGSSSNSGHKRGGSAVRISDSGNSSADSESGSSDEMTGGNAS